jgi:hypothetical protein
MLQFLDAENILKEFLDPVKECKDKPLSNEKGDEEERVHPKQASGVCVIP